MELSVERVGGKLVVRRQVEHVEKFTIGNLQSEIEHLDREESRLLERLEAIKKRRTTLRQLIVDVNKEELEREIVEKRVDELGEGLGEQAGE